MIAASIIGGTSLLRGEGTVLGAAIFGVVENGMVMPGVNLYVQQAVIVVVILLAFSIDILQKQRRQGTGLIGRSFSLSLPRAG